MRFFIVLVLIAYLVALVYAAPTKHKPKPKPKPSSTPKPSPTSKPAPVPVTYDYVYLSNYGPQSMNKEYRNSPPVCINVDKAFSGGATFVITRGRVVDLYAGVNCTNLVRTTKPNDGDYYGFWQKLASFQVRAK
ncbi:hypothetical protein GGI08_002358 [Coemansia sp. S2]|nr:hypothetical protein GGI08_002358 [Coemansia sp. S2]KAJ2075128.1 hypothetical protein GGH13_000839 [Coemansia sp. S155-1]KAJ2339721.1 hypothetical protein GGH92_006588 [Coemansia sp. RSA 2673]